MNKSYYLTGIGLTLSSFGCSTVITLDDKVEKIIDKRESHWSDQERIISVGRHYKSSKEPKKINTPENYIE